MLYEVCSKIQSSVYKFGERRRVPSPLTVLFWRGSFFILLPVRARGETPVRLSSRGLIAFQQRVLGG